MPALPDVRPLIVNLLARYIIQCKLDGHHGLPGQRSQQDWAHLLEVLCSTIDHPSRISYSSLQFIRYVSLLEKAQKLRTGRLNEHTLTDIYKIIINFSRSPELSKGLVSDKLTSLLTAMQSGLTSSLVDDFCKKVYSFVQMAMEWYTVLPVISVAGDAIVAMETPPCAAATTTSSGESEKPGKPAVPRHQALPTKRKRMRHKSPALQSAPLPCDPSTGNTAVASDQLTGNTPAVHPTSDQIAGNTPAVQPASDQLTGSTPVVQASDHSKKHDNAEAPIPSKLPLKGVSINLSLPPSSSLPKQPNVLQAPAILLPPTSTKAKTTHTGIAKPTAVNKTKLNKQPSSNSPAKKKSSTPPPLIYIPLRASNSKEETHTADPTIIQGGGGGGSGAQSSVGDKGKQQGKENASLVGEGAVVASTRMESRTATASAIATNGPISTQTSALDSGSSGTAGHSTVGATSATTSAVMATENMIVAANTTTGGGKPDTTKTKKFALFDLETVYSAEVEWSSDESASIGGLQNTPKKQKLSTAATVAAIMQSPPNTPERINAVKRGVWSEEEAQCLTKGVKVYGEGKWKEIKAAYSVLSCRTTGQLKDKYRNIKRKKAAPEQH